mmetsp:Transcript_8978/g.30494  ORF Transcript_8978/g.30494 Transcript_8978/m.30494 type:complete len:223 (-) Transcript_8978:653-1321(-)
MTKLSEPSARAPGAAVRGTDAGPHNDRLRSKIPRERQHMRARLYSVSGPRHRLQWPAGKREPHNASALCPRAPAERRPGTARRAVPVHPEIRGGPGPGPHGPRADLAQAASRPEANGGGGSAAAAVAEAAPARAPVLARLRSARVASAPPVARVDHRAGRAHTPPPAGAPPAARAASGGQPKGALADRRAGLLRRRRAPAPVPLLRAVPATQAFLFLTIFLT